MPENEQTQWIRHLVERYQNRLLHYAQRIVGRPELAQDVVQDVFLRLWQQDRQQLDGHVAAWLYRVCRNRAIDVLGKERRMLPSAHCGDQRLWHERPENNLEIDDEQQRLSKHIERLPDKQQEVLRLKYEGGLDHKQIAECLGSTAGYVTRLIYLATSSLRQQMQPTSEDR